MKVKVSEATRHALDWMVAMAEGDRVFRPRVGRPDDWDKEAYLHDGSDNRWVVRVQSKSRARFVDCTYSPSTSWPQGGPIIERIKGFEFKQWLESTPATCCQAEIHNYEGDWIQFGPTPLIAAMRCYVVSRLGDEVEVPEELLS